MERSKLGRLKKFFSSSMWSRKSSPHSNCSSASSGRELELPPGIYYKKLAWNHSKKGRHWNIHSCRYCAQYHGMVYSAVTWRNSFTWLSTFLSWLASLLAVVLSMGFLLNNSTSGLLWLSWNSFLFSILWASLVLFGACSAFYRSGGCIVWFFKCSYSPTAVYCSKCAYIIHWCKLVEPVSNQLFRGVQQRRAVDLSVLSLVKGLRNHTWLQLLFSGKLFTTVLLLLVISTSTLQVIV